MKITNKNRLEAMLDFSEFINVSPPRSNDFNDWCSRAVNEMTERDVQLFYLVVQGALSNGLGCKVIVSKMFHELEKRKLEIDSSFCAI